MTCLNIPYKELATFNCANMIYSMYRSRQRIVVLFLSELAYTERGLDMSKRGYERKSGLTHNYVEFMGYKCANPECISGYGIEGHHVVPLSKGGADKYWNLVALCSYCHKRAKKKLHSHYDEHTATLYLWKTTQEFDRLGFCLDEEEECFTENLIKARKLIKKEREDEKRRKKAKRM